MLSYLPMNKDDFCGRPGAYGPHDIHESQLIYAGDRLSGGLYILESQL